MDIKKNINGQTTVFCLTGRLDTATAPVLQKELIPEFDVSKRIELNFSELEYITSAGLRALLTGAKTAKAKDTEFVISNVSADIMEILEVTGFTSTLIII